MVFETDAIDNSKPANKQYLEEIGLSSIGFPLLVELRDCEIGEQFTDSGRCVSCPAGESYLIEVQNEPGQCKPCPIEARCLGGSLIGP